MGEYELFWIALTLLIVAVGSTVVLVVCGLGHRRARAARRAAAVAEFERQQSAEQERLRREQACRAFPRSAEVEFHRQLERSPFVPSEWVRS